MLHNTDYQKIKEDLLALGVQKGDDLLLHASFKALGNVEGGIETLIEALISCLGDNGTLLFPTLTFRTVTAENPIFDIRTTPSCVGAIGEYFRNLEGVKRSMHPTHSVCVLGARQKEYINGHELDNEPVGENSPFYKLPQNGGKVLMLGCGTKPNTSMHGVEEKAKAPYVLSPEPRIYTCTNYDGETYKKAYYYHYIVQNGFRQQYDNLENLMEMQKGKILEANCHLIDAPTMWKVGEAKIKEDPYYFVGKLEPEQ